MRWHGSVRPRCTNSLPLCMKTTNKRGHSASGVAVQALQCAYSQGPGSGAAAGGPGAPTASMHTQPLM
eukprot:1157514-Pelagomonas_calceolata.AAC.1